MSTSTCEKPSCGDDQCPDICENLCIRADVQRGATQVIINPDESPLADTGDIEATRHLFCFSITVDNCTNSTINNFRPRLDLTPTFLLESTGVAIAGSSNDDSNALESLIVSDIVVSIGKANKSSLPGTQGFNGGLSGSVEDPSTQVLTDGVRLPPGESQFDIWVYINISNDDPDQIILLPGIFSFNGQIKCCDGKCLPIHKAVFTPCECLPLEDEA